MQQSWQPILKDLVLIGGGHSHAIALKLFAMNPILGVRLTLISDVTHTPYSGMLPGHIAGFYSYDEAHIDLRRLALFAQAQFFLDAAIGLDLDKNHVICANRPPVAFDVLSIDIGSTPQTLSVPGATDYATPAKPVPQFLARWNQLVSNWEKQVQKTLKIAIVGGGAGGVELALNIQTHLQKTIVDPQNTLLEIHLFHRDLEVLSNHNPCVRNSLKKTLINRGIQLHLQESVCAIKKIASDAYQVQCDSGLTIGCHQILWVTQASAPAWIKESGLATDEQGFIQVNDALQSISHPHVFAAGDIASMVHYSRPKAGVFAVRQGKPLYENLRQFLLGKPLKPFKPQKQYLSLIGTGDKRAIASRGWLMAESSLLWQWKDQIDRKFMEKFKDFPAMNSSTVSKGLSSLDQTQFYPKNSTMRCGGCGSKVGSSVLERVFNRLNIDLDLSNRNDILIGLNSPDDCAVVSPPATQVSLQTIDYFRALINDPFIFGQIVTHHCLSDIFAMGGTPQTALAIATLPYGVEAKVEETLYQLLAGTLKVLHQSQTALVGGHTTEASELAFGLSCNGFASPDKLLRKSGLKPGHRLILTKALGTGTLFAAERQFKVKGRWIDAAIESMLLSNQAAANCFLQHQASACTDITGFGLIGHLGEMVRASKISVELNLEALPLLAGVSETLQQGCLSSLHPQNLQAEALIHNVSVMRTHPNYPILFDPQTAGGLLAAVPESQATDCLVALKAWGYSQSCIIGQVTSGEDRACAIYLIKN